MAERTVELDAPVVTDETADALREATDRAERAEAELARLKAHAPAEAKSHAAAHTPATTDAPAAEGNLFDGQEPVPDAVATDEADAVAGDKTHTAPAGKTDAERTERAADLKSAAGSSAERARTEKGTHTAGTNHTAVHTADLKQPPTPSTARNAGTYDADTAVTERGSADTAESEGDGVDELRKDPMMAHLLDSLDAGTDVGHYGRLVFAMVARHFMPHAQVIAWMTKDSDFSAEQAQQMLHQVEGRDYTPPRRDRLMQWQKEQEFQFMDVHDPDSGNLYRNLEFPKEVYDHIGHYQDTKASE